MMSSELSPSELSPAEERMDDEARERQIRHILIALDASMNSRAALETAINLAVMMRSDVVGVFVEDINLIRLSELPFVREIRFAEREVQLLEEAGMFRRLRARAALLRRELEELANERKVTSSFEVIRGPVDQELLAAAIETDLIALGRLGHGVGRHRGLGSTARKIVDQSPAPVLLVKADTDPGPVIALYDGSENGRRALLLAAEIADHVGDLRVLVWATDEEAAYSRRMYAIRLLDKTDVRLQFQHLVGDDPRRVIEWVNRQNASLLILSGNVRNLPDDIVQVLIDEARQHILFIR